MSNQEFDVQKVREANEAHLLSSHAVSGLKRNSGYIDEEFDSRLKGTKARKKYREMEDNNPVIGASLWITEALARQVVWDTEISDSGHPLAQRGQEFGEQVFDDMETPWKETISEALSMMTFGHCALEPEFKIRRGDQDEPLLNSKYNDGLYGWREWSPRSQESIEKWVFDRTGRLVGMVQRDPNNAGYYHIPMDRLLLFRIRARKNNPEGRSLFRPAYRPHYYATRHEDIEAIGVERNIAGMPDYQVPLSVMEGQDAKALLSRNAAENLVKKVRVDHDYGLVRPAEEEGDKKTGYKFSLLSASGRSFADTGPIIQRWHTLTAQAFLTEFIFLGQGQSSTSYSAHSDKTNTLGMAISAILDIIDDISNEQALPWLMFANGFPRDAIPTRKHGTIEKKAILETFQAVTAAVSAGAMEGDDSVNNMLRQLVDLDPSEGAPVSSMLQTASMASRNLGSVGERAPTSRPPAPMSAPTSLGTFDDTTPTPVTPEVIDGDPGDDGPEWITQEEAAEMFGVSVGVIRTAINRGQLPGVGLGRTKRVNRKRIEAMLDAQGVAA